MQFKEGTSVYTPDGDHIGKISRVVIDPSSKKVTHLVVEKGIFFPEDKVIPSGSVQSATDDRVTLNSEVSTEDLPPFEVTHFVDADREDLGSNAGYPAPGMIPAFYWYPPQGYPGYAGYPVSAYGLAWAQTETERNLPENTVPLKEGADVVSKDGRPIGSVEQVFVDPDSMRTTHFIISQGLLFKDRKIVPIHWVDTIDEDRVYLSVNSRLLEHLPAYEA